MLSKRQYLALPVDEICEYFNLGNVLISPVKLPNAMLHNVWSIYTDKGRYAIKQFNSTILQITNPSNVAPDIAQNIAVNFQQKNIATSIACSGKHGYLFANEFMVFPWLYGYSLLAKPAEQKYCYAIGILLAKLHASAWIDKNLPLPNWLGFPKQHWENLLAINFPATTFTNIADLTKYSELAQQASEFLIQDLCVSHRDVHQKNVVWNVAAQPYLIDWDYAGLINPQLELITVALNWSINLTEDFVFAATAFQAVLAGYCAYRKMPEFKSVVIYAYVGYLLDWLEWNLRRAIAIPCQAEMANQEINATLKALNFVCQHRQELLDLSNKVIIASRK